MSAQVAPDQPVEHKEDDKLGRAAFGARLAALIETAPVARGLVIGLAAPWGEGKTSALNLTKEALAGPIAAGSIQLIDFNPWLWSGTGHLVEQFFARLARETGPERATTKPKVAWPADLPKTLAAYGSTLGALSHIPTDASSALLAAGILVSVGGFVVTRLKPKAVPGQETLVDQRDHIADLLRNAPARLVVFIDDLDRLQDQEIKDVAQLVKLIADFPNIIYVLAYDRVRVEAALGGTGYLDKIVQVPLDLPAPHPQVLEALLDAAIDRSIKPLQAVRWDQERWPRIHDDGVFPLLSTARDAKRFANAVVVVSTEVGSEVNGVDLVAVTALRIFVPEVYRAMAQDQDLFLGPIIEIRRGDRDKRKKRLDDLIDATGERRAAVEQLLRTLFPELDGLFTNTQHGWEMYRDDLRICARAMYWRYFTLSLPEGEVPEERLRAAFASSARQDPSFDGTLLGLLAGPSANYFVARFALWVGGLATRERLAPIRAALPHFLSMSDQREGLGFVSQRTQMISLPYRMLEDVDDRGERLEMALAIARDPSVTAAIELLNWCAKGQRGSPAVLNDAEVREMSNVIIERVRQMSDDETVALEPFWYLAALKKWGAPNEARTRFEELARRDDVFLSLLQAAIVVDVHHQGGAPRIVRRMDTTGLEDYADIKSLRERAQRLLGTASLAADDRGTLELLLAQREPTSSPA